MTNSFPPNREADLVTFTQNFATKITATPTAYSLSAAQATAYTALSTAFISAYNVANADATRSPMNVNLKDVAKHSLLVNLRLLCRIVQNAPTTTNAMRIDLGIPQRGTMPSPIPAPAMAPVITVLSTSGRTVGVRLTDPSAPTRRGRPPRVSGISVFSYIGAAPPADITAWKFEANTSLMKFDVAFAPTVPNGATVWLTAFFFNSRKASGPACNPVSANLPGGNVSMQFVANELPERKAA